VLFTAFLVIEKLLQKYSLYSRHRSTLLPTSLYANKDRAATDNFLVTLVLASGEGEFPSWVSAICASHLIAPPHHPLHFQHMLKRIFFLGDDPNDYWANSGSFGVLFRVQSRHDIFLVILELSLRIGNMYNHFVSRCAPHHLEQNMSHGGMGVTAHRMEANILFQRHLTQVCL
jgi:hypothetical protein